MWKRLQKPELTLANILSDRIWQMEQRRPGNFPEFNSKEPLLIFSDYGGAHSGSRFESYAYFLTQPAILPRWESDRLSIRQAYGFRIGRMAYKKLGVSVDPKRQHAVDRALRPWLVAADNLNGLLVTFLVDRTLGSFFAKRDLERLKKQAPEFAALNNKVIEKLFRACHFLSLLIAGLSTARQELVWITDDDPIAQTANSDRLLLLKWAFLQVSALYLEEKPENLHCETTAFDNGSLQIEDLASLPDLVAGALADVQTQQAIHNRLPAGYDAVPIPNCVSPKSKEILNWLVFPDRALRRMVFAIYPAGHGQIHMNKIVFLSI